MINRKRLPRRRFTPPRNDRCLNFKFVICFLFGIYYLLFGTSHFVSAATEFVSIIDPDQGTGYDFQYLSTWESVTQVDLATTTTKVFSHSGIVGAIPDASTLVGTSSGAVASTTRVTATQILLYNITGTFESGEKLYIQGAGTDNNYVYLTDAGDSAIAVATCRSTGGSADINAVTINGWETSSTTYIKIWTNPDDEYGRHNGVWDDDKYVLGVTTDTALQIFESYVYVDGLQVDNISPADWTDKAIWISPSNTNSKIYILNNIIRGHNPKTSWINGISVYDGTGTGDIYIGNNIIYDFTTSTSYGGGMYFEDTDFTSYVYNNTVLDTGNCFSQVLGTVNLVNNIAQGCTFGYDGTFNLEDYNISDDGTVTGTNSISSTTVSFMDAINKNFHLSQNDTIARNAGTSTLYSTFYIPYSKYDIDGTARGGAFDIGADEVPVQFVSTICENTSAGGDCSNMDYYALYSWEAAVQSNLTSSTTRVFTGTISGILSGNSTINLCNGSTDTGIDGVVVATTSDKILVDGITGTTTPLITVDGYIWNDDACGTANNYWTISGTGDDLGASPAAVAKIDGTWFSADKVSLNISGWDTDIDNYIKIYTVGDARHRGVWSDTKYRLDIDGDDGILQRSSNVIIDGLQIHNVPNTGGNDVGIVTVIEEDTDGVLQVSNNIIKGNIHNTYSGCHALWGYTVASNISVNIYNNIIYNIGNADGIYGYGSAKEVKIYNNTLFNIERYGITGSANKVVMNNIVASTSDPFYGTFNSDTRYNATDGTDTPTGSFNSIIGADFDFVSTASGTEDLHIGENSDAINVGFDLTASTSLFIADIDGSERNVDGLSWDIGADEVATKIYRSVGNTDTDLSNTATVTISGTTATFSSAQPDNIGVGDVIQYGGAGYYQLAFITARASSTEYSVQSYNGGLPSATTTASMEIFRAYLELDDWNTNNASAVNSGIDSTVEGLVVMNKDLVSSGTIMMVPCYASDNGDIGTNIHDWITGVGNYVKVYTPVDDNEVGTRQRHQGVWDDDYYYLSATNDNGIYSSDLYVRIDGLQIAVNGSSNYGIEGMWIEDGEGEYYISNNIIKAATGEEDFGIYLGDSDINIAYIWNNIIYGGWGKGIWASAPNIKYVYNNTIVGCEVYGMQGANDDYEFFYNNIVVDTESKNDWFLISDANASNNMSNGESPMGPDGVQAKPIFVDELNDNYHLAPTDTTAIDAGTSTISNFQFPISNDIYYDIDGNYRRTWDIGADEASIEYVASVMEDGTGDFTTLAAWEDGIESDLTASTTAVFTATTSVGQFQSYEISSRLFTGQNSNATGQLIHISTSSSDIEQVLLININGDFEVGEEISDGYGTTTLENLGNPVIAVAKIDGVWSGADTNTLDIDGWETGANNYIRVYTTDTARHRGKWDDNKYVLNYGISIDEGYVNINGLQIDVDLAYVNGVSINSTQAKEVYVLNNIIRGDNNIGESGIYVSNASGDFKNYIYNNIIYDFNYDDLWAGGMELTGSGGTNYIYNNTVYNNSRGILTNSGSNILINNIAYNSRYTDYYAYGVSSGSTNNISSDDSADDDSSMQNYILNASVDFVDVASGDFHLSYDDTVARDAGTSTVIASEAWQSQSLIYDIDGTTRGAAWDIGADELPVSFVSTICENTTAGGDCAEMDYSSLYDWEDAVEVDLTATSTRVFGGSLTSGNLDMDDTVYLLDTRGVSIARGTVVATTSDQILVDNIIASSSLPVYATTTGYIWRLDGANYWTVTGSGDDLGASPMAVAKIDGTWSASTTQPFAVAGWETDSDNSIKIYTTTLARHNGKWDENKFRIFYRAVDNWHTVFGIDENFVSLDGLQVDFDDGGFATAVGAINISGVDSIDTDNLAIISNSIIRSTGDTTGNGYGILNNGGTIYSRKILLYNNIIYGFNGMGIGIQNQSDRYYYNNTVYGNGGIGIHSAGVLLKNNLSLNNGGDDFFSTLWAHSSSTHNISSDDTADDSVFTNGIVNQDASSTFVDIANYDFHIKENSVAHNTGVDLSNDPYSDFLTDIDGSERNIDGLGWDIGADEVVTKIYRSVGNTSTDLSNTATVTVSGSIATFSAEQPDNVGVGDVIQYGGAGYYQLAFITARASSTEYSVQSYNGGIPTATTTATMAIYRAHLTINDWEDQTLAQVNTGISDTVEDLVLVNQDLVTSGVIMMVPCYASDGGDTESVTISGWTTGGQNYINIYTPVYSNEVGESQRHNGKWDDSKYNLIVSNDSGIVVQERFVRFEGLQTMIDSTNANSQQVFKVESTVGTEGAIYIASNIIRGYAGNTRSYHRGISEYNFGTGGGLLAYNNIIYDFRGGTRSLGIVSGTSNGSYFPVLAFNNTIYNCDYGLRDHSNNSMLAINNIVNNCTDPYFGTFINGSSYNLSSDSDVPGASSISDTDVQFVDEINDDFHLSPNDTSAIDNGVPFLSSPMLEYDIDGNYRRTWDIGADEASIEYVASVMEDGTGDFTTLAVWEDGVESDIVATTTAVFTVTTSVGQFQAYEVSSRLFVGQSSGATGQLIHISTSSSEVEQVLLVNISGNFEAGEGISDGYGTTTLINWGNPAIAVAKIDGVWNTAESATAINGSWTTGPNNFIQIYTTETARHNGKWNDSKYRLVSTNQWGSALYVSVRYVHVDGIQAYGAYNDSDGTNNAVYASKKGFEISNSIMKSIMKSSGSGVQVDAMEDGGSAKIWNNIIYDFVNLGQGGGVYCDYGGVGATFWIYNNTFYNTDEGVRITGDATYGTKVYFYNNLAQKNADFAYGFGNLTDIYSYNNLSEDSTATTKGGTDCIIDSTVEFEDVASGDFHLSYDDTIARDAGTSTISNFQFPISNYYDIDSTARGASWDIGADELPVSFVSTICEDISAGGDCSEMDYSTLTDWEEAVEVDLTATNTRVFGGTLTSGNLDTNDLVYLLDTSNNSVARGTVVATTSDQILIDNIIASSSLPVYATTTGYVWRLDGANYWTVTGSGDDLGASPMAVAKIDGSWMAAETSTVNINNCTTDNDNSIKIYTTSEARHRGRWDDTAYRIVVNSGMAVYNHENNIRISGLQMYRDSLESISVLEITNIDSIDNIIEIDSNIVKANIISSGWQTGIRLDDSDINNARVYNNIVYNIAHSSAPQAMAISDEGVYSNYIYNNTIYSSTMGIRSFGYTIAKNNIVASTTDPFYGTFYTGTDYNATDIADNPGVGSNNLESKNFDFISTASGTEDFHIGIDSDARDVGFDLTASTSLVTTDVDGTVRPFGSTWDIGADEYTKYTIYRSMGYDNTSFLQCGGGANNMNVSSSTALATFDSDIIDKIGVGDAIVYNASSSIIFISGRTDSTHYTVQTVSGTNPSDITNESDWCIYRAYTTLQRAENGIENSGIPSAVRNFDDWVPGGEASNSDLGRDMLTSKEQWNIACYADAKNEGNMTVDGWSPSEEYYLRIYTPFAENEVGISQRHSGSWDDNKFVIEDDNTVIATQRNYLRIEGLQIDKNGSSGYGGIFTNDPYFQKGLHVYNNIIRCTGTCKNSADQDGINLAWIAGVVEIKNNIIYGFSNSGGASGMRLAGVYAGENQDYIQSVIANNTVYGNYYGIRIYGDGGSLYNNLSVKNEIDYVIEDSLIDNGNNISSDATSPDVSFRNQSVSFVDEANYDFHLSPDDTVAIDNGTSILETNPYLSFTDDIDGNYRRTWDIGADEASLEFESSVMESGGDFSSLVAWENAVQTDLKATSTAVFSCASATGTFPVDSTVVGTSTGATATIKLMSTSTNQILLYDISDDFEMGEKVYIQGGSTSTNYCILADAGNPVIATAKIDGTWTNAETNEIDIDGWETGENNYIKIYTSNTARHNGKWDDNKYRLIGSTDLYFIMGEDYLIVDGLQFQQTSGYDRSIVISAHDGKNTLANSIIVGYASDPRLLIDDQADSEMTLFIYNNIFYDANAIMLRTWDDESHTVYIFNNTIYNCDTGIYGGIVDDIVVNNLIASTTNPFSGSFHTSSTHNATDDSDTVSGGNNTFNNLNFDFDDVVGRDFHLGDNSGALNIGTTTDWIPVFGGMKKEYDIDGTARGGAFDIGADELPVEFVSTICEDSSAGGDCGEMDYSRLYDWEAAVDSNLSLESTRVFSGSITGTLSESNGLNLCNGSIDTGINASVIATTSNQILVDNITNSISPLVVKSGYSWEYGTCGSATNYWTITGSGDDLGASARAVAKIDGEWSGADTERVIISGWTTDNDNAIKIYTTAEARHSGVWDDTKYRLNYVSDNNYRSAIDIYHENYVQIDGLQIRIDNDGYAQGEGIHMGEFNDWTDIVISNNIIEGIIDTYAYGGISVDTNNARVVAYNNIISGYDGTTNTYAVTQYGNSELIFYNNTLFNNDYGLDSDGNLLARNNIIASTTNPFNGTFAAGTMYNATDGTDTPTGGTNTINNANFDFVSTVSGSEDFHIGENSDVINAGFDLTASTSLFTTDIDGSARNVDEFGWDIGADERGTKIYRSVGNTSTALSTGDTVTISGSTATFSDDQPETIGVGDVIQYGTSSPYRIAFITGRVSSTEYSVQAYDGGIPTATTSAVMSIYRAYLELNDWETNNEDSVNSGIDESVDQLVPVGTDLVASGTIMMVPCYASDDGDNAPVQINGWTTSEQNYINIYTPATSDEVGISQKHNGVWNEDKYYIYNDADESGSYLTTIYIVENHVRIDGLQIGIACINHGAISYALPTLESNNSFIANNIIKNLGSENEIGIAIYSYWSWINIYNNIFYDFDNGEGIRRIDGWAHTYNNTFYNCQYAYYSGDYRVPNIYNNIAQNCGIKCFYGELGSESDYNISSDGTAPGDHSMTTTTVKFVDEANDDFHLSPYDTTAIDAGTNTPVIASEAWQSQSVNYDIDGNYRRSWDIGADEASIEYVASVMEDGTGDFTTLSSWEDTIESDLTASTTAVFTATTSVGQFQSYEVSSRLFVGQNSGATGQLIHIAISTSDIEQILLVNISGDFEIGEEIGDGYGTTTLEDIGNPVIAVGKIDGEWKSADDMAVLINGWETGANNYIKIYTTDTARHNGKWDDNKYKIEASAEWGSIFYVDEAYIRVEGLQFYNSASVNQPQGITFSSSESIGENHFLNNIIKFPSSYTSLYQAAFNLMRGGENKKFYIYNNIIYDAYIGIEIDPWAVYPISDYYIYNNTIIDSKNIGIYIAFDSTAANDNELYLKNNIIQGDNTNYSFYGTSFLGIYEHSNNISSDLSSPDGGYDNTTVKFVDSANNDFHLSSNDIAARNRGTNLISNFQFPVFNYYDIDGTARGAAWDIGADEVPVQFVSTICENTLAGGDCYEMDYNSLVDWEDAVESDLTASSTRVFGGYISGSLVEDTSVNLCNGVIDTGIDASVVATTSDQILVDGIVGTITPVIAGSAYSWEDGVCGSATNYWTVNGSGDDYGASAMAVAKIDGVWVSAEEESSANATLTISGWETDLDNRIKVYTASDARHDGVWDNSKYRIIITAVNDYRRAIYINEENVDVDGLQIGVNAGTYTQIEGIEIGMNIGDIVDYAFSNNVITQLSGSTIYTMGIGGDSGNNPTGEVRIYNNIIYGFKGWGIVNYVDGDYYIYNNTIYNTGTGISAYRGSTVAKNNLIASTTNPFNYTNFAAGTDYNSTDINDTPGVGNNNLVNQTFDFASTTIGDFHLTSDDTGARNKGINLQYDENLPITTDIDGETRHVVWDIGADQYSSGAQSINTQQDDLFDGLVGYWNFNEGYGTTVADLSGNGNDGTWNGDGSYWTGYGKYGNAGIFSENQSDYVDLSSPDSLDNLTDFTYSMWVYATDDVTVNSPIIEKGNGSSIRKSIRYESAFGSTQRRIYARVDFDTTDAYVEAVNDTYSLSVWEHLVLVYDSGERKIRLFLNGKEVEYITNTIGEGDVVDDSSEEIWFGSNPGTAFYGFDGRIDEARIYDRVLSQREIAQLYSEGEAAVEWNFRNNYKDSGLICANDDTKCKDLTVGGTGNTFGGGYLEESTTALNLDGSGYAYIADESYFDMATGSEFSIVATVKTISNNNMMIISKKNNGAATSQGFNLGIDNGAGDGIVYWGVSDGIDQFTVVSNVIINDGDWHTIEVAYDPDTLSNNKIFIDGIDRTGSRTGALGNVDDLSTTAGVFIGRSGNDGNYFTGSIDRVAFFPYTFNKSDFVRENAAGYSMRAGHLDQDRSQNADWDPFGGSAPIAWWKLDEFTGTTVGDYASSSLNGTWYGTGTSTWHTNGKIGMGGQFNGSDDYIDVGDLDALNSQSAFTISAWVKDTDVLDNNYTIIFEKWISDAFDISAAISNEIFYFEVGNPNNSYSYITNIYDIINKNEWFHLVCIFDGNQAIALNRASVYINGKKQELSFGADFPTVSYNLSGENFEISSDRYPWKGNIDDVKVYDYARTPAQIAWDYNQGKPLVHLKFDEATSGSADGATLIDSIGNFNGTGDDGANDTGLDWVSGKWGGAIDFDNDDDVVNIGSDDSLDNLSEMTVCAWIKQESSGGTYGVFVSKAGSGYLGWNFYTRSIGVGNGFGFSYWNTSDSSIWKDNRFVIEPDTWYHLCASYDGSRESSGITLYVDGNYIAHTNQHGDVGFVENDAANDLTIGIGGGYSFGGLIDDVKIYNYVRTEEQIKEDYVGGRVKF